MCNIEEGFRLIEYGYELNNNLTYVYFKEISNAFHSDLSKVYKHEDSYLAKTFGLQAWERNLFFEEKSLGSAKEEGLSSELIAISEKTLKYKENEVADIRRVDQIIRQTNDQIKQLEEKTPYPWEAISLLRTTLQASLKGMDHIAKYLI